METASNYRVERWIAFFLTLLFFLPFVARADEAPSVAWRCQPTHIEGFRQCALVMDEQVVTWRMARADQNLHVRISDDTIEIARDGAEWQKLGRIEELKAQIRRARHSSRSNP